MSFHLKLASFRYLYAPHRVPMVKAAPKTFPPHPHPAASLSIARNVFHLNSVHLKVASFFNVAPHRMPMVNAALEFSGRTGPGLVRRQSESASRIHHPLPRIGFVPSLLRPTGFPW